MISRRRFDVALNGFSAARQSVLQAGLTLEAGADGQVPFTIGTISARKHEAGGVRRGVPIVRADPFS